MLLKPHSKNCQTEVQCHSPTRNYIALVITFQRRYCGRQQVLTWYITMSKNTFNMNGLRAIIRLFLHFSPTTHSHNVRRHGVYSPWEGHTYSVTGMVSNVACPEHGGTASHTPLPQRKKSGMTTRNYSVFPIALWRYQGICIDILFSLIFSRDT